MSIVAEPCGQMHSPALSFLPFEVFENFPDPRTEEGSCLLRGQEGFSALPLHHFLHSAPLEQQHSERQREEQHSFVMKVGRGGLAKWIRRRLPILGARVRILLRPVIRLGDLDSL